MTRSNPQSESFEGQDVLRFITAGSVDDGKSTLIGRLLLESKSIYQDQLDSVTLESERRGDPYLDLALFTDGLKAEREQRITIDVAYRYFSTPKRKFIIADCPGHIQYTRNMVTGASTAELAIILIDAKKGLLPQSKRHAFIASLLNIPHLLVAINKMDLVDYDEAHYNSILNQFMDFASKLETKSINFVPISALEGDNVVAKSDRMPWYQGGTLLHHLENANTGASQNTVDFRLPIQYVIRPNQGFRGFAGRISSGRVQLGEEVVALPSGVRSRVTKLLQGGEEHQECFFGDSVVVQLEDDIDISRGDLLVRANNLPKKSDTLDTTLCWLAEVGMRENQDYILRIGTREVQARVAKIDYQIDVNRMRRQEAAPLELNDLGRIQFQLSDAIFFDNYRRNRETGAFVLIDPGSHNTVAAGMIRGVTPRLERQQSPAKEKNLTPPERLVSLSQREQRRGHKGGVIWLTGLSGSGKSTIAMNLEKELFEQGKEVVLLDGDAVRMGLCSDLGFSDQDRRENIRRVAELAALLARQGVIVICAFISPFRRDRERARKAAGGRFFEVQVKCSLEVCEQRDPKGLYKKARRGEISNFTGIDSAYEEALEPELVLDTAESKVEQSVASLLAAVQETFER